MTTLTPCFVDTFAGCRCEWSDEYLIKRLDPGCPIEEHRLARADWHSPRRILAELGRGFAERARRLIFWGA